MAECSLCHSKNVQLLEGGDDRIYYSCNVCSLIFADPRHHLTPGEEKERYLNHRNSLEDENYLYFLKKAVDPAIAFLNKNMRGLDYGCGPVAAIQHILKDQNIYCDSFDPFFLPEVLHPPYDFIFSTEVFEHFFKPAEEMIKLDNMLQSNGFIIVMTAFHPGRKHFNAWYYKRDPSHVCFYDLSTFKFICKNFNYKRIYTDNNRVIILKKNDQD